MFFVGSLSKSDSHETVVTCLLAHFVFRSDFPAISKVLSSDFVAMHRALSIVLSHHGGYLQSYAADRRARLQRCVALVSEFEVSVKLDVGVLSPSALSLGAVLMARILRFAPDLVPPDEEGSDEAISELMVCRAGFDLCCLRDHLRDLCAEQRSADRAATPLPPGGLSELCAVG